MKDKASYNDDAKKLCDLMAEGIQVGRNLIEVREEFNLEMADFKLSTDDAGSELGGATGKEATEEKEGSRGAEVGGS